MRLLQLRFSAFGPFPTEQTLDFTKLQQNALFLVTGDTGAGKTSIFDAISFALYGEVNGKRKEPRTLKSDFAPKDRLCYVEFRFESHGETYQIYREPEQLSPKQRGKGFVTRKHKAELTLPDGKKITDLKEIKQKIEQEIIGLSSDHFYKIVMLPQGQFQKLLTEKNTDKLATFRTIFGTEYFQKVTDAFYSSTKSVEQENRLLIQQNQNLRSKIHIVDSALEQELHSEFPDDAACLKLLQQQNQRMEQELQQLERNIQQKETEFQQAANQLTHQRELHQQQERLQKFQGKQNQLEAQQAEIATQKQFLQQLKQVEQIRGMEQQLRDVEKMFLEGQNRKNELQQQLQQVRQSKQELYHQQEQLYAQAEGMERVQQQLDSLRQLFPSVEQLETFQQKQMELEQSISWTEQAAERQRMAVESTQLRELFRLMQTKEQKEKEQKEKEAVYQQGCKRYFEAQAFLLGEQLQPGQPCPVCGSREHPCPALGGEEQIVSYQEVLSLQHQRDEVQTQLLQLEQQLEAKQQQLSDWRIDTPDFQEQLEQRIAQLKEILQTPLEGWDLEEPYQEQLRRLNSQLEQTTEYLIPLREKIWQEDGTLPTLEGIQQSVSQLELKLSQYRSQRESCEQKETQLQTQFSQLEGQIIQLEQELEQKKQQKDQLEGQFTQFLQQSHLEEQEYQTLVAQLEQIPQLEADIRSYETECSNVQAVLQELALQLNGQELLQLSVLEQKQQQLQEEKQRLTKEREQLLQQFHQNVSCEEEYRAHLEEIQQLTEKYGILKKLSDLTKGTTKRMGFEKYVLAFYFDRIISRANLRFDQMTNGRYRMERMKGQTDGFDIQVMDFYTGQTRHISTLSGGETFLASLALSLGLADIIMQQNGGIQLNTMFVDEGFGSLDSDALRQAIHCFTQLNQGHRMVGIISHVPELREQIANQFVVEKNTAGSGSKVFLKQANQ